MRGDARLDGQRRARLREAPLDGGGRADALVEEDDLWRSWGAHGEIVGSSWGAHGELMGSSWGDRERG